MAILKRERYKINLGRQQQLRRDTMETIVKSVKIAGMQAAVHIHKGSYLETPDIFTLEEAEKVAKATEIRRRNITGVAFPN